MIEFIEFDNKIEAKKIEIILDNFRRVLKDEQLKTGKYLDDDSILKLISDAFLQQLNKSDLGISNLNIEYKNDYIQKITSYINKEYCIDGRASISIFSTDINIKIYNKISKIFYDDKKYNKFKKTFTSTFLHELVHIHQFVNKDLLDLQTDNNKYKDIINSKKMYNKKTITYLSKVSEIDAHSQQAYYDLRKQNISKTEFEDKFNNGSKFKLSSALQNYDLTFTRNSKVYQILKKRILDLYDKNF